MTEKPYLNIILKTLNFMKTSKPTQYMYLTTKCNEKGTWRGHDNVLKAVVRVWVYEGKQKCVSSMTKTTLPQEWDKRKANTSYDVLKLLF